MLDNPWFTINQRSVTTWTEGFGVDRWCVTNHLSATVGLGNILTLTSNSSDQNIKQKMENLSDIADHYVTISILISDGTLYTATDHIPASPQVWTKLVEAMTPFGSVVLTYDGTNTQLYINVNNGQSISIRAAKVELGKISTLANDTAPNYAIELAKCRYYYYHEYYIGDSSCSGAQSNVIYFSKALPKMRTNPTAILVNFQLKVNGNNYSGFTYGALIYQKTCTITATKASHGITNSNQIFIDGYLNLSAEL